MDVRTRRESLGLTQAEVARRAGVSRQLVGAVEAGRHLPRVDSAVAIARVLGVDVAALFTRSAEPVDALSGEAPPDGALVRSARVGDRVVTVTARIDRDGWDVADAVVEDGKLTSIASQGPGIVVAGCEPGLLALERHLRASGSGAVAVGASSAAARRALAAGRLHAAVVHGPQPASGVTELVAARFGVARWQVGLAAPAASPAGSWRDAFAARVPVVQREQGAGVQRTFEESLTIGATAVPGPIAAGHLDAVRRSLSSGMPAVTIEPAALALGAAFHPLDVHTVELWVAEQWASTRVVADALEVLSSGGFQRRLAAVGGYDLAECGMRVA